ncbi:unnamed protein product [Allacma fusca]|uniref:Uncharacterized protein n=1 Tax=Allacma fusca TaxID=39272 RepID=A0A8J2J8X9_9HEXA|nr:unnamed protein product [Allacma fusca]
MSISRQTDLVQNEDFKIWARSTTFDLIIYSNTGMDIAAALASKMKAKLIAFTPAGASPMTDVDIHGLPVESSWLHDWSLGSKYFFIPDHFAFAYNTISWYLSYKWSYLPRLDYLVKELYPEDDIPPMEELIRNVSLIFLNEHYSTGYPRALPPFVIPVGGLYTKESDGTLPKDLEAFISTADQFVFISFGSAIKYSKLTEELQSLMIEVLASFENINFLWKWDGEVPKTLPKNIFFSKVLRQNDVLGHKNCKGFITQGDQISSHQAAFHGVPMVVIPVWEDQLFNARSLEYNGIGIYVELSEITEEALRNALLNILTNPWFSNNGKLISDRFKDRPLSPLATALWWTEYVLRHDTAHLKSPGVYQYWWQRRLLDFYFAILFAGILLVVVRIYIGRLILRFMIKIFYKAKDKLKRS